MDLVALMTQRVPSQIDSGQTVVFPGITGPQACSRDRIGVTGWAPITEALAIAKAGVVPVEIYYRCLGAFVS